jgi:hypothetical protein
MRLLLCCAALAWLSLAQSQTGSAGSTQGSPSGKAQRIDSEIVEVTTLGATPSVINRSTGKFFLVLRGRAGAAPPALVFDSPGFATAQVGTLTSDFNASSLQLHGRQSVLLNLPAGELDVKLQSTGKVILKIITH